MFFFSRDEASRECFCSSFHFFGGEEEGSAWCLLVFFGLLSRKPHYRSFFSGVDALYATAIRSAEGQAFRRNFNVDCRRVPRSRIGPLTLLLLLLLSLFEKLGTEAPVAIFPALTTHKRQWRRSPPGLFCRLGLSR